MFSNLNKKRVNKRYVPKLRFKEFKNTWQIEYVKNLFYITRGYVLSKNKLIENGFPVYSSQTLNNGLLGFYDQFLYEDSITWTTDGANAGTINFRKGKFYCTNVCGVLLEKKEKPSIYFSYLLSRITKKYVSYGLGNPKLMNNTMGDIEIIYSVNLKEQEKISKFLNLLDKQISLLENKLKLTEQLKHNYSKNLFANKSNTPKLRFKGFDKKFKIDNFSNIVSFARSGGTPKSSELKYYKNGIIPFLSINDLNQKYLTNCNKKITRLAIDETSTFIFEKNNILLSIYATIGEVAINKIDVALPQSILGIKIKNNINLEYFYYLLLANKKKFVKNSQTGSQPNLSLKIVNNIQFQFSANLKEQEKISIFLSLLDKQIDNISRKIEIIKNQKKFFFK